MGAKFEVGDFLKKDNKKGSFMIYEGNDLNTNSTFKKLSLLCYYDPESFKQNNIGVYEYQPILEVEDKNSPCSTTIDTDAEDFWVKKCSDLEKNAAIKILFDHYGLLWNEETLELIDAESGEVIRKIVVPDNTYYGQIVRPITKKFKELMKKYCFDKNKLTYNPYNRGYYEDYYDD
jgi:hypothetical protein